MSACRGNDDRGGQPRRQYACGRRSAGAPARRRPASPPTSWNRSSRTRCSNCSAGADHPAPAELTTARATLEAAKRALASYRDKTALQQTLGDDDFRAGLEVRRDRVERALIALADARSRQAIGDLPTPVELEASWPLP